MTPPPFNDDWHRRAATFTRKLERFMTGLSNRRWPALLALALGGFAIGLTEFVAMGLLPDIARDLLPAQYARSAPNALAHAGLMISVYALGVVIGAPLFATLAARVPRRRMVLGLLSLFIAGTAASALAPTFGLVLVGRFIAALPHGAYFGAAGLVAASLMGPGKQGRGFAVVLGGLTVANVVGVPIITRLGQAAGWRAAYLTIALVFALTLLTVVITVPDVPGHADGSPRAELRAFRAPQVWLVAAIGAIGFSGLFAINSYIAPVTTRVTGMRASTVPWILVALGLGMTAGNAAGGWLADRNLRRTTLLGFPAFITSMVLFGLFARVPAGLFAGAFLVGATALFLGPAMQARLIEVAPRAQLMGAAVNQSAMNIGNSLGALLGGAVIASGFGFVAPTWVGVGMGLVGYALAGVSFALDRRTRAGVRVVPGPGQNVSAAEREDRIAA